MVELGDNNAQPATGSPLVLWEDVTNILYVKPDDTNKNVIIDCTSENVCISGKDTNSDDVDDNASDNFGMSVWLYSDAAFETWAALRETSDDRTEDEKTYIDQQSGYTIKIECNFEVYGTSSAASAKANFACCLRDDS